LAGAFSTQAFMECALSRLIHDVVVIVVVLKCVFVVRSLLPLGGQIA